MPPHSLFSFRLNNGLSFHLSNRSCFRPFDLQLYCSTNHSRTIFPEMLQLRYTKVRQVAQWRQLVIRLKPCSCASDSSSPDCQFVWFNHLLHLIIGFLILNTSEQHVVQWGHTSPAGTSHGPLCRHLIAFNYSWSTLQVWQVPSMSWPPMDLDSCTVCVKVLSSSQVENLIKGSGFWVFFIISPWYLPSSPREELNLTVVVCQVQQLFLQSLSFSILAHWYLSLWIEIRVDHYYQC